MTPLVKVLKINDPIIPLNLGMTKSFEEYLFSEEFILLNCMLIQFNTFYIIIVFSQIQSFETSEDHLVPKPSDMHGPTVYINFKVFWSLHLNIDN